MLGTLVVVGRGVSGGERTVVGANVAAVAHEVGEETAWFAAVGGCVTLRDTAGSPWYCGG